MEVCAGRAYAQAEEYWSTVRPTVDGVLGGFGRLSKKDVSESEKFLLTNLPSVSGSGRGEEDPLAALDCGAGIGRVTNELLLDYFESVDVEEALPHFLEEARKRVGARIAEGGGGFKAAQARKRTVKFISTPSQNFHPEEGRYDCIWLQWFVGHMPDEHLVAFLGRCKRGLRPNGRIFVKENVVGEVGAPEYDEVDGSWTRSVENFRNVFREAELEVQSVAVQKEWPQQLFSVHMFCLRGCEN